ncbi:hypothetical protein [Arthrobacter sp.]|uniref:hypothetical protein n=1 Tax=Arthrobacter sp. TaxID=1667 RepID=UPI00289FC6AC|nr:hypothetical protein [Arthrobacter sp.]
MNIPAIALDAGVGFESRFVWRSADYTPVLAELLVPQGSLPRPDQWNQLIRCAFDRNRRYAKTFTHELLSVLPIVRRLPHRIGRVTGSLADGRFGMNVRMLADSRDRSFLREIIGLAVVTFLAGIFGIRAATLLTSDTGPQLSNTLTLFQVFGYLFLVVAGILTLRALFDVLRRRPTRSR